jgi:hypothetical protein
MTTESVVGLSPRSAALFICICARAYAKALGYSREGTDAIMVDFANELFRGSGECSDPDAHEALEHLYRSLMEREPH